MQEFFEKNLKENEKRMKKSFSLGRNAINGCAILLLKGGDRITDKQKIFARLYAICDNAAEAYAQAFGLKDRDQASKRGRELLKRDEITDFVKREKKLRELDRGKVIELLAAVAFTSPASLAEIVEEGGKQKIRWKNFDELPEEVKAAVAVIKNTPSGINVETLDRLKATDLLLKHLRLRDDETDGVVIEGEREIEE